MKRPQITPGPWRPCLHLDMTPPRTKVEAGNKVVCDTIAHEANARAIAALPALITTLETIHANAAESAEWIRIRTRTALESAGYDFN